MKHTDEQIDKIIHEALSKEEAEFYDQLGEQSLLEMSLGVFQSRNKVIYIMAVIMTFIFFGVFVYCAYKFFNAEEIRDMLIYAGVGFWSIISVTALKLWHWMRMNTNQVLREMKRLELQVSTLTSELKKKN